jgi:hypothetical protein
MMTAVEGAVFASGAFAAGQVVGVVILATIIGFAIRDQIRKRR